MTPDPDGLIADSRFLSYLLRHDPGRIGVILDGAGWVDVAELLTALAAHGRSIDADRLAVLVAGLDKQRLEIRDGRIRATEGHSLPVELGLTALAPPAVLFHGTVERFIAGIRRSGLKARGRTHLHLSADVETARQVGARRGTPIVLTVDAAGLHAAGHAFYRTTNGVWLTDAVPPAYLIAEP